MPFDLDAVVGRAMTRQAVLDGIAFERASYSPHMPTPRQDLFLNLKTAEEVFYGGAAGGGKSDALLMAALEYIDVPYYSALILRKTFKDLSLPGALMDRAHRWFTGTGAEWSSENKRWTFPGGGSITFGHLEAENDKLKYQSSEFQFIGFDELTQFTETQYQFLFSRLRRPEGHSEALGRVPLRMRGASNPPHDPGGLWVKARFVPEGFQPDDAIEAKVWEKEQLDDWTGEVRHTYFVPARLDDNPHIDREAYDRSLSRMDPVTRAQLRRGDWQIAVSGDILHDWSEPHVIVPWKNFCRVLRLSDQKIPLHWQLGVFQDWGATKGHPCITGWFATAAENTPPVKFRDSAGNLLFEVPIAGSVFWYRTHIRSTGSIMASGIKRDMLNYMIPDNEVARCHTWQTGHDALSERNEYNHPDDYSGISLPFDNWPAGYTRGIEQLKTAIAPRHRHEPHPFNPGVWGRPKLFIIVDDHQATAYQVVLDGHDKGQSRARAEAPAYKWAVPKSGEVAPTLKPHTLFNDAMDVARAAAASYWPMMEELTVKEVLRLRMQQRLPYLNQGDTVLSEGRQIAAAIVRAQEIREMQREFAIDEFGEETDPPDVVDISQGY
jgi:Terminase large subunit, T4likevirus-type, N-terminal